MEHVEKYHGGAMCKSCGGVVGEDGMSLELAEGDDPGTVDVADDMKAEKNPLDASFARAMKRNLNSKEI